MNKNEEVDYSKEEGINQQLANDSGANADFSLELSDACKIVGIGEQFIGDLGRVLQEYHAQYWVHEENHELEKMVDLIDARNVLVRTNLLTQIYDTGAFIMPQTVFENSCSKCRGTGELFLFNRVPKEVECNRCEDGIVWVRCRSCKGSTRYTSRFKEGGGIDVECKTCIDSPPEHKGQIAVKCRVCKGTKTAKIMVLDHTLKSTTPCPACDELGFIIPKKEKTVSTMGPDNPVLAGDLAEKLKDQIDDNKFFDSEEKD